MNAGIPLKCVALIQFGKVPSDKQMKMAVQLRETAYSEGFDFLGSSN